jgi:hypothetical protein
VKKQNKQSNVLLWAKIIQKSTIFEHISPQKVGILLVLACCLLKSKTSCLYKASDKISTCLGFGNQQSVDYQHFIKFFQTGKGDLIQRAILQFIVLFLFKTCSSCHLVLDRTNWEYGETHKNILCIGAIYFGCFIPLVWIDLNKGGNSLMQTRLDLIGQLKEQWTEVLPFPPIHLSGDREFIGEYWLRQLVKMDILFVIRIKKNKKCQVWFNNGIKERAIKIGVLHKYLTKKGLNAHEIILVGDYIARFIVLENTSPQPDEPYLYLITNIDDTEQAAQLYRMRWKIECCFKHLKTNGFNLEKQNFTAPHKIELLMSLLVLVNAMAIYEGVIIHQTDEKPKMKTYKVKEKNGGFRCVTYPAKSVFRSGLSKIEDIIINLNDFIAYIELIIYDLNALNQTFIH